MHMTKRESGGWGRGKGGGRGGEAFGGRGGGGAFYVHTQS